MVKTLRITSVVAVLLAGVVLASVLGYLSPAALMHLDSGAGGDKQVDKILAGPTALERFRQQYGNKAPDPNGTTPPLVKQAEILAGILTPPAPPEPPVKSPTATPSKPTIAAKPLAVVSGKFELLQTSYCSDPQFCFAYIRLPDNTFQWVGAGSEIGHIMIREIHNGSIVCWDGTAESEMTAVPTPETSSLLETNSATPAAAPAGSQPALGGKTVPSPVKRASSAAGYTWERQVAPTPESPAAPVAPAPSAQISKEEQEDLSRLGDRLKTSGAIGAAEREQVNKMIAEFRAGRFREAEAGNAENGGGPADGNKAPSGEALRLQFKKRLSMTRAMNR